MTDSNTRQRLTGLARYGKTRDVLYQPWRKLVAGPSRPQGCDGVLARLEREGCRGGESGQGIFRVTFVGIGSETRHRLSEGADLYSGSSSFDLGGIR